MTTELATDFEAFLKDRTEDLAECWLDNFFSDEQAAFEHWRQIGLDPELTLPRPQLSDPAHWRVCVAWSENEWDKLCNQFTILVAGLQWGSLDSSQLECKPSLGETEDGWGLVGSFSVRLGRYPDDFQTVLLGSASPAQPLWLDLSGRQAPWELIAGELPASADGSLERALGQFLPPDLRSPLFEDLGCAITFALGRTALTHGLKATLEQWRELNKVLQSAEVFGLSPSTS